MPGAFVVEVKSPIWCGSDIHHTCPVSLVVQRQRSARLLPRRGERRAWMVNGLQRTLREGVQDIRQQQLLMLLFVSNTQLQQRRNLRPLAGGERTQPLQHPLIDGPPILS